LHPTLKKVRSKNSFLCKLEKKDTTDVSRRGFTFIEILFVVIIIGIMIGVSVPNFRNAFNDIQLRSFSRQLQFFMNYLHERAIVERKIISLNIDNKNRKYWAKIKELPVPLKTYSLPPDIDIEIDRNEILFYPDGEIDKITIKIISANKQEVCLTTEGTFGAVRLQYQH